MRGYIKTGKVWKIVDIISGGQEEAKNILIELIRPLETSWEQVKLLMDIDDMNIREEQVVLAYQFCKQDVSVLRNCIETRDGNMVTYLNNSYVGEEAVIKGAYRYDKKAFEPHAPIVYIIDTGWRVMVQIQSAGVLILESPAGRQRKIEIQYLSDEFFMADGDIWHICEFADMLLQNRLKCIPVNQLTSETSKVRYGECLYVPPRTVKEKKKYAKNKKIKRG